MGPYSMYCSAHMRDLARVVEAILDMAQKMARFGMRINLMPAAPMPVCEIREEEGGGGRDAHKLDAGSADACLRDQGGRVHGRVRRGRRSAASPKGRVRRGSIRGAGGAVSPKEGEREVTNRAQTGGQIGLGFSNPIGHHGPIGQSDPIGNRGAHLP